MASDNVEKNQTYMGTWYVPGHENEFSFHGTLTIKKFEYPQFHFVSPNDSAMDYFHQEYPDTILGITDECDNVTIHAPIEDRVSLSKQIVYKGEALWSFIGGHFPSKEDIKFRKISVEYSCLDDWVRDSPFYEIGRQLRKYGKANIKWMPEKVLFEFRHGKIKFKLLEGYSLSVITTKFKMTRSIIFEIVSDEQIGFSELTALLYNNNYLVSFMLGTYTKPAAILGWSTLFEDQYKEEKNTIKIYSPLIKGENNKNSYHKMTLNYDALLRYKADFMKIWFQRIDEIKPILFNYLKSKGKDKDVLDVFSGLSNGIEAYHRLRYDSKKTPMLNKRIASILGRFPFLSDTILKEASLFPGRVAKARHAITHLNQHSNGLDIEFILDATIVLQIILQCCILEHFGFDHKDIEELTRKYIEKNYFNRLSI